MEASLPLANTAAPAAKAISLLNSKLRSDNAHQKAEALRQLRKIALQYPSDTVAEHAVSWMLQCCKPSPWSSTTNDQLRMLRVLIAYSIRNVDSKKLTVSTVLPQFVRQLTNGCANFAKSSVKLQLECSKKFLDAYGSSCNPYRNDFRKFVFHCLERYARTKTIVEEAAACFAKLCSGVSKGRREQAAIMGEDAWSSQFTRLIATCHKLFDSVYAGVHVLPVDATYQEESGTENAIASLVELEPAYEKNPSSRFRRWTAKFGVIVELLKALLTCGHSTCKSFKPSELLRLIRRSVVSVTPVTLAKCALTNDLAALVNSLWRIHAYAFDILESLIVSAGRNLIPYGSFICNLCTHTIKWCHDCSPGQSFEYLRLRSKVYSVLSKWIWVAKSSSSIEIFADDLVAAVTADISFIKPAVQLNMNAKTRPSRKRRADGKFTLRLVSEPPPAAAADSAFLLVDRRANERLCMSAHRVLRALLSNTSTALARHHHRHLQRTLVELALRSYEDPRSNHHASFTYRHAKCRLRLLKSLLELVLGSHRSCNSPIALATRAFEAGSQDPRIQVSAFCVRALNTLETMTHPTNATLARFDFEPSVTGTEDVTPSSFDAEAERHVFAADCRAPPTAELKSSVVVEEVENATEYSHRRTQNGYDEWMTERVAPPPHIPATGNDSRYTLSIQRFFGSSVCEEPSLPPTTSMTTTTAMTNVTNEDKPIAKETITCTTQIDGHPLSEECTRRLCLESLLDDFVDTLQ